MRKSMLAVGVLTTLFGLGLSVPASAQMCSPGQQAQAQGGMSGGGMCGMGQAADDPMADKPAQAPKSTGMMCPCCRNMAMMRGGSGGSGGMMQHHNMPSMEMPKPQ
jgi:hypothetical protein